MVARIDRKYYPGALVSARHAIPHSVSSTCRAKMPSSSHKVLSRLTSASAMTSASGQGHAAGASGGPRIVNANSRSLSLASVSSDGSTESHVVEQEDIIALTQDVRSFKEALNKLRKVFQPDQHESLASLKIIGHERLSEVLRILRHMLEKYPALQSNDLVAAAGLLIRKVKEFDYGAEDPNLADPKEFFESLDGLALAFSSRVSEYLMGDLDSNISSTPTESSNTKSYENLLGPQEAEAVDRAAAGLAHFLPPHVEDEVISPDKIDSLLMHHDCGVDLALQRAKIWSKYAKDVINYVEKRIAMQLDLAKNLTKLVQTSRPQLQEESYLPFQSIYCTALDNDLELCASIQTSCGLLQGYKVNVELMKLLSFSLTQFLVPGAPAVQADRAREDAEAPEGVLAQGAQANARRGGQAEEGEDRLHPEAPGVGEVQGRGQNSRAGGGDRGDWRKQGELISEMIICNIIGICVAAGQKKEAGG